MNKDTGILVVIIGGVVLLFWAISRGLLGGVGPTGLVTNPRTGQTVGAIVTPQPTQNYSGFLAASTAPGVAGALNGALSGIGNAFSSWFGGGQQGPSTVGQAANPNSPAMAAQPSGPSPSTLAAQITEANVGPQVAQAISYDSTAGTAYGWMDLAGDNSFDPSYSLQGV